MAWLDFADGILEAGMNAFGEPIEYTPSGMTMVLTVGVFDNQYEAVDPNTGVTVSTTGPILGVKNSNLPRVPLYQDQVRVRGQDYRVYDVQPDGHGGSKLLLHVI